MNPDGVNDVLVFARGLIAVRQEPFPTEGDGPEVREVQPQRPAAARGPLDLRPRRKGPVSEAELFDDEYLVASCDECNAGQGHETLPLRFIAKVLRVRTARRRNAS
jgi:hypothetical protein